MPDKTPQGHLAVARPPGAWFSHKRVGSSLVLFPGFPICASVAVYLTLAVPTSGARRGFPSSPALLFLHATACGLRRTLIPSPIRVLLCCLRCTLKPSASATTHFEAVPALQGARHPYGLQDALSTLRLSCSPPSGDSATDARLDTGGWLALTRRGLPPRKKRRAYLGAITFELSRSHRLAGGCGLSEGLGVTRSVLLRFTIFLGSVRAALPSDQQTA